MLTALQEKIAFLPDYSSRKRAEAKSDGPGAEGGAKPAEGARTEERGNLGTTSGIVGLITLALVFWPVSF
jgi:hypothetical protein